MVWWQDTCSNPFNNWKNKLGVHEWDWVHERLFMPEGAARGHKKRSCTQSHSWTPFIHQFMMDHPSYAIILQIHIFNLPKVLEKTTIYIATFHIWKFLLNRRLAWNVPFKTGVCVVRVHTPGRITTNIYDALRIFNITFSEILSYFSNKINQLKIINFMRVG